MQILRDNKVLVSTGEVAAFNARWPCSELRPDRAYWFQFDLHGNLINSDLPEQDDGAAACALAQDCKMYLLEDCIPPWSFPEIEKLTQKVPGAYPTHEDKMDKLHSRLKVYVYDEDVHIDDRSIWLRMVADRIYMDVSTMDKGKFKV